MNKYPGRNGARSSGNFALQPDSGPIRILLVEDDEVDALLVKRTLARSASAVGHLIESPLLKHVPDLDEALELLAREPVDVILLDLNLGRSRGIETFFRVHEFAPGIPVVVLTGLAEDEIAVQAIRSGAQDFIAKEQLDARILGRAIRYALERQHLRQAQRKAQEYLDIAAVIMVVLDHDGKVTLINRRGSEILDYPENEIVGRDWFEHFIPGRVRAELRAVFEQAMNGVATGADYHENPVLTRTGEERLIAWHNRVVFDARGRPAGILSSGEDITERRRAEEASRESERRLSTLMANLPGMAYRCRNDARWTMHFVSQWVRVLTGYAPDALIDNRKLAWVDLIHPADREAIWQQVQSAIERQQPFQLEYRIHTATDEERWVMDHGRAVDVPDEGVMLEGIVTDLTERKQAEQALQRYAGRLRTLQTLDREILAAQSPGAVAEVALSSIGDLVPATCCAMVLLFDEDCVEMTVLASSMEAAGTRPGDRFPVAGLPGEALLRQGHEVTLAALEPVADQAPFLRALVEHGAAAGTAVPLRVREELIGILVLLRYETGEFDPADVTVARELADSLAIAIHQGRLFERIREYSRELEQRVEARTRALRDTNAELEAFAYSVSHDLRNPLSNIRGFGELLRDSYAERLGEDGLDLLVSILEAVRDMDTLIEDLLGYSRVTRAEVELTAVPLDTVVDTVVEQYSRNLATVGGRVEVVRPLPTVRSHAATLERVLANLLSNAIKFVPPETRPAVRIRAEPGGGGRVRVWVEDNGIGIDPADQERIFRVFERAATQYPGTGVGLATVRRGVERLGGEVGVDSEPGRGSRFWIELPEP